MNFNLTGITKRSKTFHYHISYTWPDGKIRYVEMRREKLERNRIYLRCTHKTKCSAKLFVSFTDQIKTQSTGSRFCKFTEDTTDEIIANKDNYTDVSHRHVGRCFSTITTDGLCISTKHDPDCYKINGSTSKIELFFN